MRVEAPHTVTFGALYTLMGLADQISSDRCEGYEGEVNSISPNTSHLTQACVGAGWEHL